MFLSLFYLDNRIFITNIYKKIEFMDSIIAGASVIVAGLSGCLAAIGAGIGQGTAAGQAG